MNVDLVAAVADVGKTLFGAFAGAWIAFRFERHRQRQDTIERDFAAGNAALLSIFSMWNVLRQYQKEAIDELPQGDDFRWFHLPANPATAHAAVPLDLGALGFLLQTKHANVVADLALERRRYDLALELIRLHSDLVLGEVHRRMSDAGIPPGGSLTEAKLNQILGINVLNQVRQLGTAIYTNVNEDVASLRQVFERLRGALVETFPTKKPIEVRFEPP